MNAYLALRLKLCELYPLQEDWLRKNREAGIRPGSIALQGKPSNVWTSILDAAHESNLTSSLMNAISADHPASEELAKLIARYLEELKVSSSEDRLIPDPPHLYARPPYIGSHKFIGREDQLGLLSDWAAPSNANPVLLFEAIGGMGKSMLTWEWTTKHASNARSDWAGILWYSFYEGGANLSDFCSHALAYITGKEAQDFNKIKLPELADILVAKLTRRPWLLVLDGLERILVAYHRIDCETLLDEVANNPEDKVGSRHPCAAVQVEDHELLLRLTTAVPSKILITSRLTPRSFVNRNGDRMPGVLHLPLVGLRPSDAERMLRSVGVTGNSLGIQSFLKRHCDCHPLVTGIVGGLINGYLADKGNFDAWSTEPRYGGHLEVGNLDLVQKRNHILRTAIDALADKSRHMLSIVSMLSGPVDYATLSELYSAVARNVYQSSDEDPKPRFSATIDDALIDLGVRGLIQYDHTTKRYDLHPVVRAVASGLLDKQEKDGAGEVLIDYFSQKQQKPFDAVTSLEDVQVQLQIIRTYLELGKLDKACDAYLGKICNALEFKLHAYPQTLEILQPFFAAGWDKFPDCVGPVDAQHLARHATKALDEMGFDDQARALSLAGIRESMARQCDEDVIESIVSYNNSLDPRRVALRLSLAELAYQIATIDGGNKHLLLRSIDYISMLGTVGDYERAEELWKAMVERDEWFLIPNHLKGGEYLTYAELQFHQGMLTERVIEAATAPINASGNRSLRHRVHSLRGEWCLVRGDFKAARSSLSEAIRLLREVGSDAPSDAILLCITNLHLGGNEEDIRREAEQFSDEGRGKDLYLGELFLTVGDQVRSHKHALEAYMTAWADGEPYVDRFDLGRARALLVKLCKPIPELPPYNPVNDAENALLEDIRAYVGDLVSP